jgi:hypothetical protein
LFRGETVLEEGGGAGQLIEPFTGEEPVEHGKEIHQGEGHADHHGVVRQ